MNMRLHVFPASPNSRKVMVVSRLTGLKLPEVTVNLMAGEQRTAAFLLLNPNGKTPVLECDDGTSLWESNAISNRLALEAGSALWPGDERERLDVMRWQFWEAAHFSPACAKFLTPLFDPEAAFDVDAATKGFHRVAKILDGHLHGREWLVGNAMTTADVAVAAALGLRHIVNHPMDGFAAIDAWLERIEALPEWSETAPSWPTDQKER